MKSSMRDLIVLTVGLALLSGVCVYVLVVVSWYEQAYSVFAPDLDKPLRLLFQTYRWWLLALIPAVVLWLSARSPRTAANRTAVFCIVIAALLALFAWWALQPRMLCCDIQGNTEQVARPAWASSEAPMLRCGELKSGCPGRMPVAILASPERLPFLSLQRVGRRLSAHTEYLRRTEETAGVPRGGKPFNASCVSDIRTSRYGTTPGRLPRSPALALASLLVWSPG